MKILKLDRNIDLILASIGVAQSFYLSAFSFFGRKRSLKNILLAAFFFSITLRIVKSILWVYLETTPNWFLNLGFVAHSAFGPLLLLYVYYYVFREKWSQLQLLHFLPSVFLLVFVFFLFPSNFWYIGGYKALLYHQLIYSCLSVLLLSVSLYKRKQNTLQKKDWIWLNILVIGTLILQLSYFSNYVLGLTPYLLGPIVYGVFVYFLSFFLIKNPQVLKSLKEFKKYRNINLSSNDLKVYVDKIEFLMDNEKPYLNADFGLNQLSKSITLPAYLVSHVINKSYDKNFPDFINSYRIDIAKNMLTDSSYCNFKISSIAYECGFNSLSSFNIAFKKHTNLTPSLFKKRLSDL